VWCGPTGIATDHDLVEQRRATVDSESSDRHAIRDLREQLAELTELTELTGHVDHHVAVIVEDLRGTHRYTTIATIQHRMHLSRKSYARQPPAQHR
jgi:predicted  nucleic acid-binding Zn-ribbon protein